MKEKCCFACVSVYIIRIQAWYHINLSQLGATCLTELMIREFFLSLQVTPIPHTLYPAEEEAKVVELLRHGRITGRPVLQFSCVGSTDEEIRSSFSGLFI